MGLTVTVEDQGIGVAKENQDKIFNRFERAVSYHNISGIGLGLYIANQIVEIQGGKIILESELNVGSRFTILLPSKHVECSSK